MRLSLMRMYHPTYFFFLSSLPSPPPPLFPLSSPLSLFSFPYHPPSCVHMTVHVYPGHLTKTLLLFLPYSCIVSANYRDDLNRYSILELQPGVSESDIKIQFRKKSLLIHPDKTKNPQAPDAFDRLKKAQAELSDEKTRGRLDEAFTDARMLLIRERKWTIDNEELKTPEFMVDWREKTKQVLIENELRKRKQIKAQLAEEGREQRKAEAEAEARKRKRENEQAWEDTRDQRISSWRNFQKSSGEKKKKKPKPLG